MIKVLCNQYVAPTLRNPQKGLTLVELAIVLVIVGLLASAVLSGQELIKQAYIHKNIKAFNELSLAWNSFQAKYHALPGDIRNPEMFFPKCEPDGNESAVIGNGDGRIEQFQDSEGNSHFEGSCIWFHLKHSGLYNPAGHKSGSFAAGYPSEDINFETAASYYAQWMNGSAVDIKEKRYSGYQASKLAGRRILHSSSRPDDDYFVGAYTAYELYSIDAKIDDGRPSNGRLIGNLEGWGLDEFCYTDFSTAPPVIPTDAEYVRTGKKKGCVFLWVLD